VRCSAVIDEVHENCGLCLVKLDEVKKLPVGSVVGYLYEMLLQVQNRGQLSAGITTFSKERAQLIDTFKGNGLVNEVFRTNHELESKKIFERYSGTKGIGHVRYATSGADDCDCAQPFERHHGRTWKWFSFGFNGNLANYQDLKKELEKNDYHIIREGDTEVIMHFIAKSFAGEKKPEMENAFTKLADSFDGCYNIVYLNADGDMVALRDPIGFRPLCWGRNEDGMVAAASESSALNTIGIENVKDIEPGTMLKITNGNVEEVKFAKKAQVRRCMFELVYFSNVASNFDGRSVYESRYELGKQLAKAEAQKFDGDAIVVAVPDSAKPVADAIGYELGIPVKEGLIRNRYVGRTFIESKNRKEKVRDKFTLNKSVLRDKKVIMVEDSIVRGTTSQILVDFIKKEGKAKEVHLRVSCPPIRFPCFYGIDMSTMSELIATNTFPEKDSIDPSELSENEFNEIRKKLHVDSLQYQSREGLVKGTGFPKEELCMACLNGDYPTECGKKLLKKAFENYKNPEADKKRTYD